MSAVDLACGFLSPEVSVTSDIESSLAADGLFGCAKRRPIHDAVGGLHHSAVEDLSPDVFQVDIAAERTEQ